MMNDPAEKVMNDAKYKVTWKNIAASVLAALMSLSVYAKEAAYGKF